LVSIGAVLALDAALWRGTVGGRRGLRLQPARNPWPRPGRGGARTALCGVAPWLGLVVLVLAWDVLGIDTGPRQYHLTISALAQAYRPLNAALLLVWMLVGVGYEAARVRAPVDGTQSWLPGRGAKTPETGATFAAAASGGSIGAHHGVTGLLLPQSPAAGVAFWVAVPVVAVLLDATARRSEGRRATAEEFVRFVSTAWPANLVLVAAWAVAGYHLFAR
jgi:hypothetical protein